MRMKLGKMDVTLAKNAFESLAWSKIIDLDNRLVLYVRRSHERRGIAAGV